MRVLVTGSAGFIGRHLVAELPGASVVDLVVGADIRDPEILAGITELDPEVVFHLAAEHFIPWCNEHPRETLSVNVDGTRRLLGALGPSVRTIVFASSAAVYGFAPDPISEQRLLAPVDVYGRSKVWGEDALDVYSERHPHVACVAARLFNVVGSGDRHAHVLPAIAETVRGGGVVDIGNHWPMRDYVHVRDAAAALMVLAETAEPGWEAFNIGTGIGTSVEDLLGIFSDVAGRPVAGGIDPARVRSTDGHLVAETAKIAGWCGWYPRRPLEVAVRELLEAA